ncbi:uncharacterized protein LOC116194736 isoform X3 [Punica granatum]|nr:uncharacterized protein LOC116194736 isoform X3 [Punica granatum]
MIFNHDAPRCFDCSDCGGPLHCGMQCSALVANDVGGYPVCTAIGHASGINISIADKKNPHSGVIVKMSSVNQEVDGKKVNCSLTVTVLCDYSGAQGPHILERSGACDYATVLRHPSGCAKVVYIHGRGWVWFGIFVILMFSLLGGYLLAGTVYRYFVLGVHGIDAIPNLEFWANLPHRTQCGNSGDRLKALEAHILPSTFEEPRLSTVLDWVINFGSLDSTLHREFQVLRHNCEISTGKISREIQFHCDVPCHIYSIVGRYYPVDQVMGLQKYKKNFPILILM